MKAYKATEKNMQCREFQFELNKEFVQGGEIELCWNGFHFCKDLKDVFNYYRFTPFHRFFEVEIPDDAEVIHGGDKSVTNKIKFIRELSSEDIKELTSDNVYIDDDGGYVGFDCTAFYNESGKFHRDDGPAAVYADGSEGWYQNGIPHRDDGPAITRADGHQEWRQNGFLHRVNGPAIVYSTNAQMWCQNGKRHREDGPAVVYADGHQEFWINGVRRK